MDNNRSEVTSMLFSHRFELFQVYPVHGRFQKGCKMQLFQIDNPIFNSTSNVHICQKSEKLNDHVLELP